MHVVEDWSRSWNWKASRVEKKKKDFTTSTVPYLPGWPQRHDSVLCTSTYSLYLPV